MVQHPVRHDQVVSPLPAAQWQVRQRLGHVGLVPGDAVAAVVRGGLLAREQHGGGEVHDVDEGGAEVERLEGARAVAAAEVEDGEAGAGAEGGDDELRFEDRVGEAGVGVVVGARVGCVVCFELFGMGWHFECG